MNIEFCKSVDQKSGGKRENSSGCYGVLDGTMEDPLFGSVRFTESRTRSTLVYDMAECRQGETG